MKINISLTATWDPCSFVGPDWGVWGGRRRAFFDIADTCKITHYAEYSDLQFPEMSEPAKPRGSLKCNIAEKHMESEKKRVELD